MNKVLISIIGNQTIPNILFIKEITDINDFLFIYTSQVEKELDSIIDVIQIENPIKLEVPAFDLKKTREELTKLDLSKADEYIINVTGGTKLMALAVYQHFVDYPNSQISYLPIGKNTYQIIFPSLEEQAITSNISVEEYLKAYNVSFIKPQNLSREISYTHSFADGFISKKGFSGEEFKLLTQILPNLKKKPKYNIAYINGLEQLLNRIEFKTKQNNILSYSEKLYLAGGWFEEYMYTLLKKHLALEDQDILLNVVIPYGKVKNEYDVLFIYHNQLFVIECKTGLKEEKRFNDAMYKLGALREQFGIDAKSYLFSLSNYWDKKNEDYKKLFMDRAEQNKVKLVDRRVIENEEKLIDKIKELVKNNLSTI